MRLLTWLTVLFLLTACGAAPSDSPQEPSPSQLAARLIEEAPAIRERLIALDPRLSTATGLELVRLTRDALHHTINFGSGYAVSLGLPLQALEYALTNPTAAYRCFGISTLYEYAMLSFGVPTRHVGLYNTRNLEEEDTETHSVLEVQVGGRWIAVDPTFNLFWQDDTGRKIGFAEVVQRHYAGLPVSPQYDETGSENAWEAQSFDAYTYFENVVVYPGPGDESSDDYFSETPWDGTVFYLGEWELQSIENSGTALAVKEAFETMWE